MARSYGQLIPSVERRLTTWVSLSERYAPASARGTCPTITISRRFGCEGYPLSERLKALLDETSGDVWNIYDKALLERVSRDEHLSMELLTRLGSPSRAADTLGFLLPGYQTHDEVFRRITKHIVHLAEAGNAIIVGRGGAIITRHLDNCYHFRLDASLEFRVASIARRLEIPEPEAIEMVRKNESRRNQFIDDSLQTSAIDLSLYDAVFNNARHTVTEIAASIVAYVAESRQERGRP